MCGVGTLKRGEGALVQGEGGVANPPCRGRPLTPLRGFPLLSVGLEAYALCSEGCANPRKFANICEFISEICEFGLEELH